MKDLVGRKVKGFKFKTEEEEISYSPLMDDWIGKVGVIVNQAPSFCAVEFEDKTWCYPIREIEEHLIDENDSNENQKEYKDYEICIGYNAPISDFDKVQEEFQDIALSNKECYMNFQQILFEECMALTRRKNSDYTGDSDDPFANFRRSEVVGVPVEQGILVRIMDKISRITSYIEKGELEVKDESVQDTIQDAINYFSLLSGYIKMK